MIQLQSKLRTTSTKRILSKAKDKWLTALVMTAAVGSLAFGTVTVAADEVTFDPSVAVNTAAPIDAGAVAVAAEQNVSDEGAEVVEEVNTPVLGASDADQADMAPAVVEPEAAVNAVEITGAEVNETIAETAAQAVIEPLPESTLPVAAQLNRKDPKDQVNDKVEPDSGAGVSPEAALEAYPIVTNIQYGVEAGETLTSVAEKFDSTAAAIAAANGIRGKSKLRPGTILTIPSAEAKPMDIAASYDERRVVMLDPGHGGTDPGAVNTSYGIEEADLNLNLANILTLKLEEAGFEVLTTRTGDETVDFVTERSAITNAAAADIFISLHHNASSDGKVSGIETYYYRYVKGYTPKINPLYHNNGQRITDSAYLAKLVQADLIAATGAVNRGVKSETFAVLRETAIPAILIEFGFMSNQADLAELNTEAYQLQLADAVVKAVNTYFTKLY